MNRKSKILFIVILLFVSKSVLSQLYIEPTIKYKSPINRENNNITFYNQFMYTINGDVKRNKIDTTMVNLSNNVYYGLNLGYNINKNIDIWAGYEYASTITNYNIVKENRTFVMQNYEYVNLFDYYKEFRNTQKINIDLNYLHLYKVGIRYSIPFDNLSIFGDFNLVYSNLKVTKTTGYETIIYKDYDSLLIYHIDTDDYSSRVLVSKTIKSVKEEYYFNNNISYDVDLGIDIFLNKKLSLLFKVGYQNNYNQSIYKKEYNDGEFTGKIFTDERLLFPTMSFGVSMKYKLDFKKSDKNKEAEKNEPEKNNNTETEKKPDE